MIQMFLKDKGDLTTLTSEKIELENDLSKLEVWVKLAADSKTVKEFEQNM